MNDEINKNSGKNRKPEYLKLYDKEDIDYIEKLVTTHDNAKNKQVKDVILQILESYLPVNRSLYMK